MKRCIAALLILLLIAAVSLYNIRHIDVMTQTLLKKVNTAEQHALSGEFTEAASQMEQAAEMWEENNTYAYVFLRHAEVDTTADVFCEVLAELYDENAAGAKGMIRKLRAHLTTIAAMEHIRVETIF